MLQRGLLQGRVRQARGGLAQAGDRAGQVGAPGPDQHLGRAGQRVEPPAVGGGEGVLLGRAAQREVHGADGGDRGGAVRAEADHPVGRDVQPQRRQQRRQRGPRPGRGRGPGGRAGDALGGGDQAAGGAGLPPGGGQQPVQGQAVPLHEHQRDSRQPGRGGERGERRQRHHVPGGHPPEPQDRRCRGGDGDLAGGQPGQHPVGHLDVSGDGDGIGHVTVHQRLPSGGCVRVPGTRRGGGPRGRGSWRGRCGRARHAGQRQLPVPVPAAPGRRRRGVGRRR